MSRRRAWLAAAALLIAPACSAGGESEEGGGGGGGGRSSTTEAGETTTTAEVSEDPDQALIDAVDATLETESFTVDGEANLDIASQQLRLTSSGSVDYADLVAGVVIGVDQGGEETEVEIRSDGSTLWVRSDGSGGLELPDGKTWVQGEVSQLEDSDSFAPKNLIGVIIALRAAEGTEAGDTAEIDGVSATSYTTTVDYDAAVEAAGEDREVFESALSLTSEDPVALDIEVHVGDDGIVRRFDLEIDAGSAPLGGDYTIELTDVGEEVDPPEAPDEADTVTGAEAEPFLDQLLN